MRNYENNKSDYDEDGYKIPMSNHLIDGRLKPIMYETVKAPNSIDKQMRLSPERVIKRIEKAKVDHVKRIKKDSIDEYT